MRDKKGTGHKDVSGDVLRSMVEDGLRLMTTDQNIHETGEWHKDFIEVKMITCQGKTKNYKVKRPLHSQPQHTYSKSSSDDI